MLHPQLDTGEYKQIMEKTERTEFACGAQLWHKEPSYIHTTPTTETCICTMNMRKRGKSNKVHPVVTTFCQFAVFTQMWGWGGGTKERGWNTNQRRTFLTAPCTLLHHEKITSNLKGFFFFFVTYIHKDNNSDDVKWQNNSGRPCWSDLLALNTWGWSRSLLKVFISNEAEGV